MILDPPVIRDVGCEEFTLVTRFFFQHGQQIHLTVFVIHTLFLFRCRLGLIFTSQQLIETVVLTLHFRAHHKRPFRKHNGLIRIVAVLVYHFQAQCIAADDVPAEYKSHGLPAILADFLLADILIFRIPDIIEPLAAGDYIIDQQIHAINACHGDDRLFLKFERQRFFLSRRYGPFLCGLQLAAQDLGYEIAVTARWLQKPAVNTLRLLFYQIQHGVDLTLGCEYLAVLGHTLSSADLNTLFGIYDRLGMTAETILLLIHHCADKLRRRYGEGRLPTMRAIEKEAFYWANREILTAPQAEEYLAALARRDEEMEKVRHALSLTGRELTPTERKYIESWLSMGYGAEALAIAYDRTVVGTGKLAWAYMDKIVKSWYEKKLFTAAEIEKGDSRASSRAKPAAESAPRRTGGDDLARLEGILKNIGG